MFLLGETQRQRSLFRRAGAFLQVRDFPTSLGFGPGKSFSVRGGPRHTSVFAPRPQSLGAISSLHREQHHHLQPLGAGGCGLNFPPVAGHNGGGHRQADAEPAPAITFDGTAITTTSDAVTVDGSTATITQEGTYLLSGTLTDGTLLIDAPDTAKIQLVLDGVTLHSESYAPIYIREADKVFLTLAPGSENTLSNSGTYTQQDDHNVDAPLFCRSDLTLNGTGSLTVESPGGHGVVCKDDLVVTGGTYTVTAASHGLSANDSVRIGGGTFTVTAGEFSTSFTLEDITYSSASGGAMGQPGGSMGGGPGGTPPDSASGGTMP